MSDRGQRHQMELPTTPPSEVHVPVRVVVDFAGPVVRPLAFLWNGRKYGVERVNLRYKKQLGDRWLWSFAVSDNANSYVLTYDPEEMRWMLEEVYER